MKHKDMKTFSEKMKQEENTLLKARKLNQPDINELSSMYDKIPTTLQPEGIAFDLPIFIERFEQLQRQIIEDSLQIKAQSDLVQQSYLKLQEKLMKISQFHEADSIE